MPNESMDDVKYAAIARINYRSVSKTQKKQSEDNSHKRHHHICKNKSCQLSFPLHLSPVTQTSSSQK